MGTSICHSVISQMINFFVVCCFVNPGSDPSSDLGSKSFLLRYSRSSCMKGRGRRILFLSLIVAIIISLNAIGA